jgi:hypothetical protein
MTVSKNLAVSLGLAICTVMTGCGGAASSEDISEIRSLLEDLDILEERTPEEEVAQEETTEEEVTQEETTEEEVTQEETTEEEVAQEETAATLAGQLTWEPAGFYEDGTVMTLDEISHYQIVFGTAENALSETVELNIAGLLTYDFSAAAGHTWYVGVKTVSIYGGVSDVSNLTEFNI